MANKIAKAVDEDLATLVKTYPNKLQSVTLSDGATSKTMIATTDLRIDVHKRIGAVKAEPAKKDAAKKDDAKKSDKKTGKEPETSPDPAPDQQLTKVVGKLQANRGATHKSVRSFLKGKTGAHKGTHQVLGKPFEFDIGPGASVDPIIAAIWRIQNGEDDEEAEEAAK